jgi:hypothetical protein
MASGAGRVGVSGSVVTRLEMAVLTNGPRRPMMN